MWPQCNRSQDKIIKAKAVNKALWVTQHTVCIMSFFLHTLLTYHLSDKPNRVFSVGENMSDREYISCCVLHVWKGNSRQCLDLILPISYEMKSNMRSKIGCKQYALLSGPNCPFFDFKSDLIIIAVASGSFFGGFSSLNHSLELSNQRHAANFTLVKIQLFLSYLITAMTSTHQI